MLIGIGIDLVKISRLERIVDRWGTRFISRVFSLSEQSYCAERTRPVLHFSGRFAVKEAVVKALGMGMTRGKWTDIETVSHPDGKPVVILHGEIARLAKERRVGAIFVSISHDADYAIAQIILSE